MVVTHCSIVVKLHQGQFGYWIILMTLKDFPCFVDHHQHTHVDISCCCNNYSVSLLCLTLSALNLQNALCYMLSILTSTKISWQILQNTRKYKIQNFGNPLKLPRMFLWINRYTIDFL